MVQKAALSDYNELLNFENKVFKVNFLSIMPKIYKDRKKCADYHYIVREDKKIAGAIALYPTTFITKGGTLKAFGIGSVAVDPKNRGKGIMRQMMECCDEEIKQQGADIGFLSGIRMRYERYGYIQSNNRYVYSVSDYYVRHIKPEESFNFISFKKCGALLSKMAALHSSQNCKWQRNEDEFKVVCSTWNESCFAITDENESFCGYLIAERNGKTVSEIVLTDAQKLSDILLCYAKKKRFKALTVYLSEWQRELRFELNKFGEDIRIESHTAFKIFNFKNFIEVMMNEKLSSEKLCEGKLNIKIEDEIYSVTVENSKCTVELTEEKEDLGFDYPGAVAALTTHHCALYDNALFAAWSPMCPISIPPVDEV